MSCGSCRKSGACPAHKNSVAPYENFFLGPSGFLVRGSGRVQCDFYTQDVSPGVFPFRVRLSVTFSASSSANDQLLTVNDPCIKNALHPVIHFVLVGNLIF